MDACVMQCALGAPTLDRSLDAAIQRRMVGTDGVQALVSLLSIVKMEGGGWGDSTAWPPEPICDEQMCP